MRKRTTDTLPKSFSTTRKGQSVGLKSKDLEPPVQANLSIGIKLPREWPKREDKVVKFVNQAKPLYSLKILKTKLKY